MNNEFNEKIKYTEKEWRERQEKEYGGVIGQIAHITIKVVAGIVIFLILFWLEGRFFDWINLDINSMVISYGSLLFSDSTSIPWGLILIIAINIYIAKKIINKFL